MWVPLGAGSRNWRGCPLLSCPHFAGNTLLLDVPSLMAVRFPTQRFSGARSPGRLVPVEQVHARGARSSLADRQVLLGALGDPARFRLPDSARHRLAPCQRCTSCSPGPSGVSACLLVPFYFLSPQIHPAIHVPVRRSAPTSEPRCTPQQSIEQTRRQKARSQPAGLWKLNTSISPIRPSASQLPRSLSSPWPSRSSLISLLGALAAAPVARPAAGGSGVALHNTFLCCSRASFSHSKQANVSAAPESLFCAALPFSQNLSRATLASVPSCPRRPRCPCQVCRSRCLPVNA
ncbi:hypothetical protein EJ04DRAFT_549633 [Polyplosphaeria fusca]|uniref:Uncharacterized protein n=1 Tax=Polyplosphaeria fusca TaxID=682080 RepID=A0A9P4V3P2_9PLEO|nr:hypothetical protein EJ04DRAFT_549633 [Polyplosphaeria fusca]